MPAAEKAASVALFSSPSLDTGVVDPMPTGTPVEASIVPSHSSPFKSTFTP